VVTSVEPVAAAGRTAWRVGFAYFTADGVAHQGTDEIYVASLEPGDEVLAVYPRGRPDLGTLQT
jgi:hypothetical protein